MDSLKTLARLGQPWSMAPMVVWCVSVELRPELGNMRVSAQLVDGSGKLALEPEEDLGAVETLGDHGTTRKSLDERRLSA